MFGEPVVTTLVRFFVCVRGCGCLLSTRLSLRPLPFEGQDFCIARAQMASREGGRAPECDESSWLFETMERTRQAKKRPAKERLCCLGFARRGSREKSLRIIHIELDRVRGHLEALDFGHFQFDIAVDEVVIEHAAILEE